ncbi:SPOSA6832_02846 [Sporobolomyces salmonicolor]|uniref:SPOSA6832_02846-mRNA-1:cds n=1 Tax=Sporidiobolus salmonicolor TaxID=5005 RepID=A0A0D6EMI7_SPOSA|nr:SPOSA6832_02846 [Sporobolomyces salmonicolor]
MDLFSACQQLALVLPSPPFPVVRLLDFLPPICALLVLLCVTIKHTRKRWEKRSTTYESVEQRARPYFSLFITREDIMLSHGLNFKPEEADVDVDAAVEATLPPTPVALALIPLAEALAWSCSAVHEAVLGSARIDVLSRAGTAATWIVALVTQVLQRSPLAPVDLLALYVVLGARAFVAATGTLHYLLHHLPFSRSTLLGQLLDFLASAILVSIILQMPLNSPLDLGVNLEQGGSEDARPNSPEDTNTLLGELTYSWMSGIMSLAKLRPLRSMDVWALSLNNRAEVLSRRFSSLRYASLPRCEANFPLLINMLYRDKTLLRQLFHASARDVLIDISLKLVAVSSEYSRPFFIQKLLENLTIATSPSLSQDPTNAPAWTPREKAYLYSFLAFVAMLSKTLAQQRHFHYARRIGMRLRSELTVAVFEKALRRKDAAGSTEHADYKSKQKAGANKGAELERASVGKVVTLISEDTNRVLRMVRYSPLVTLSEEASPTAIALQGCDSHLIYGAPLEIILGLSLLYNAFVGFGILVVGAPLNYWLGKKAINRARLVSRDRRQTTLQELITAIRTVKFFGWSTAFIDRVEEKRAEEIRWMVRGESHRHFYRKSAFLTALDQSDWIVRWLCQFLWVVISVTVPLLSFCAFTMLQHRELNVAIAFTALSFFSLVRGPLNQLPSFGILMIQLRISINRMEAFFNEEEVAPHVESAARREATRLAFDSATLAYPGADKKGFKLRNVSVDFPLGKLTVVTGPTGAGKTSLLLSLLGELDILSGSVELPSSVSYAAQQPWLESLTIQDNILFGYPLDDERYRATVQACALERDLEFLPEGDLTFTGERGVALSGGQRARLALARAIYAPTAHVLLDDIFSAVDGGTAQHLVEHLFRGPLFEGRTVVLITHHVDLALPLAAYCISLAAGHVASHGPVKSRQTVKIAKTAGVQKPAKKAAKEPPASVESAKKVSLPAGRVEGWASGAVKTHMYHIYLSSSGYVMWFLVLLFILVKPILSYLERFWLARWGEAAQRPEPVDSTYFLLGYALISTVGGVIGLLITALIYAASLRASRSLFRKLLVRVVQAPVRWFDVVPLGTISNRFVNDIGIVDDSLASNFSDFGDNLVAGAASLIVSAVILPSAIVPSLVFAVTYGAVFSRYLRVNRDVNRIAATTASPLFSSAFDSTPKTLTTGFAEALCGVTTIRAFARQTEYRHRLCQVVDDTLAFWYLGATLDHLTSPPSSRTDLNFPHLTNDYQIWLSIRTQLLAAFCLLFTALCAVYARVSPGLAGIAILSSQSVLSSVNFLCNAYGRLVLSMNSLERITEYLEVPQEPSAGVVPPANWPSSSCEGPLIRVEDLVRMVLTLSSCASYDPELPPILHQVTFDVQPGERLGIVGRTGAGKSSLATALLRFTDPSSGRILVDGLDITKVCLDDLRQRITYLPQDPALFAGKLKDNLDPFSEYSVRFKPASLVSWRTGLRSASLAPPLQDHACLDALRRVGLIGAHAANSADDSEVTSEPFDNAAIGLDTTVAAGGGNFSAGQRQLIAMARALLRDSRIVILDESTAALDAGLDAKLQRVIRDEFRDSAILTIAHRLVGKTPRRTVRDYDRVMVLSAGRIVELDTPRALLVKEDGVFKRMWAESGGEQVE